KYSHWSSARPLQAGGAGLASVSPMEPPVTASTGELARAGGDHERAFPAYERAMAEHVRGSRAAALSAARTLVPTSRLGVSGLTQGIRLISALPAGPRRALLRLTTKSGRVYESMTLDDYPPSLHTHGS
ncbi:hypothetical protein AB0J43_23980, partial [Nonomuraea fuscirosea]